MTPERTTLVDVLSQGSYGVHADLNVQFVRIGRISRYRGDKNNMKVAWQHVGGNLKSTEAQRTQGLP